MSKASQASLHARLRRVRRRARKVLFRHAENILYRMCGIPILVRSLASDRDKGRHEIRRAYARNFWAPDTSDQWLDIVAAAALFPFTILLSAGWFSWKNGKIVAERSGRPIARQFAEQIVFATTTGLLPPWYYIFELFRPENALAARDFVTRAETKQCVFPILSSPPSATSPLGDKAEFATFCEDRGIATVPVILVAEDGAVEWRKGKEALRNDLFVKPVSGRGGRGAERWDYVGAHFKSMAGEEVSEDELLRRITFRSNGVHLIVQPRVRNHPALDGFSNGVLTTVRVLSCLDEKHEPEIMGAVFRMAVGSNQTVDNFHAGGILSTVDLETGELGPASNLGTNARLGWLDVHPNTGRKITGETLPLWKDVLSLARNAHRAFRDRMIIGWDIGITPDGPILVEGNYGPDVDMMQRRNGLPLRRERFTELVAFHLRASQSPTAA